MDEILNKETLKEQMKTELSQNFSKDIIDTNQQHIEQKIEQVASFLIPLCENEYFSYFAARDPNESIELHVSNLPNGIPHFESWFNTGLLDFTKNLLPFLTQAMNCNIHFARLLDNQDYETFITNSKTKDTDIEQWKSLLNPLFQMSDTPYLIQAAACINLSLDNSALSLLQRWIQSLWFEDKKIQKVFDDAKAIVAVRDSASKAGKIGAKTRNLLSGKVKEHAIKLYLEGNFKNPSQAAERILLIVIKYGETIRFSFSSNFQAQKTIYSWLLPHKYEPRK
jgi:hypothetical protein